MGDSGILWEALKIEKVNKKSATHFALCNGEHIRYLISLNGGKKRLSLNISTYSKKLGALMKILKYLPLSILDAGGLGYFVKVEMHPAIEKHFFATKLRAWNVIVGTYDEKQKIVFQCFDFNKNSDVFIKVGNSATDDEMLKEISFLKNNQQYTSFDIPKIIGSETRSEQCPFNIQTTKEFKGIKIEPVLTKEIVRIYKEISGESRMQHGRMCEFSHGDFAPWNIKKDGNTYIVFDWEHCGMRIQGFDLMHFATIIEIVVNHRPLENAVDVALENILKIEPNFSINKQEFLSEFNKLRLEMR